MAIQPRQSDPRARPIKETGVQDILAVLRTVESRGKRESAKRLRATMGQVFRCAVATGRADGDPTGALASPICRPSRRQDQGALGLRAGSPAAQGRTRPRPLRRPLMARSSPPRPYDHRRLRLQHLPLPLAAASGGKKNLGRPASGYAAGHAKSCHHRPGPRSAHPCLHCHLQVRRPLALECQSSASFGATVLWKRSGRPRRPRR
jgi:hypothetical protein